MSVTFAPAVSPEPHDDYDTLTARVESTVRRLAGPKGVAVEPPGSARSEGPTYWY